jgi:hypothetical protein
MKDQIKKITKLPKDKLSSASGKKSAPLTPHVTYGISSPSTAATKKANSRNFSMTVSFFNPKISKPYPQDFVIRHEDLKQKLMVPQSARYASPKRDPILQNGSEGVQTFRSSCRRLPESDKMAMFSEEPTYSKKIQGEFNPITHARSLSPRVEGIRTNIEARREYSPDIFRRQLKTVNNAHQNKPNPITEGDVKGVKLIRSRSPPPFLESQRYNDTKSLLPSERGVVSRGRVFWDTKIHINTDRIELEQQEEATKRYVSPNQHRHKKGQDMKDIVEYQHAPVFRDEGVTQKVNVVPVSEQTKIVQANVNEEVKYYL